MSQPEHTVDPSAVRAIVGQFEGVRREHPHFNSAYNRAMELTSVGRASRVVIITGPTGVGKSTLGESIRKGTWKASKKECEEDPSLVPAVLVTATAPHGPSFNWKDFYIRTLEQLNEPLIEKKVYPGQQLTMFDTVPGMKSVGESLSTDPLRRQIERAFQRRKTRLWIVDEAHHILMCHNPRHLENQFEALKSLADMCNATLVLLGTYKLLEIRDHSAQLMRRSQIVHFPSYRWKKRTTGKPSRARWPRSPRNCQGLCTQTCVKKPSTSSTRPLAASASCGTCCAMPFRTPCRSTSQ